MEPQPQRQSSAPPLQQATALKCSYCGKPYPLAGATHRPFCGARCQQMDLRNWLTESYGLPFESGPERESLDPDDEFHSIE